MNRPDSFVLNHERGIRPIKRAEQLFNCFYPERARELCREEGIAEEHITRGAFVADAKRTVRWELRDWYGSPEFGAWPPQAGIEMREDLLRRGLTEEEIAE